MNNNTHIPIRSLGIHPHVIKPRVVERRGLGVQGVDEAVDSRVGLRVGLDEAREGLELGRQDGQALGGGEDGRVGPWGDGVVAG